MSHRTEQLESSLQRAIGQLISEGLNDPRVRGLISVTKVHASPDHRYAKVLVSVLPAEHEALTLKGLKAAAGHIRGLISGRLRIRSAPLLQFELDESLKKEANVLGAIREAVETTGPAEPEGEQKET